MDIEKEEDKEAIKASKEIKQLIKQEKWKEVEEKCKNFPNNEVIQSQDVTRLIKKGTKRSIEKAKEKCRKFPNAEAIQSQYITILLREGSQKSIEEAREKCRKFPNSKAIQSQYVTILIREGTRESLEEAETIASDERFSCDIIVLRKLRRIKDLLQEIRVDEDMLESQMVSSESTPLDVIKTRLYCDHMSLDFVQQIKQDDSELTEWEKVIVLLAIYDKQKSQKILGQILKEAKKYFATDNEKVKILNKLQNAILSKKPRAFNWKMFDEILDWKLDKNLYETLKNESEINQTKAIEEHKQIKKENNPKESTPREIKKVKVKEVLHVASPVKPNPHSHHLPKDVVPREKPKKVQIKTNDQLEEMIINTVFTEELIKLKAKISYRKQEDLIHDLDVTEIVEEKSISDFRAKMQLILLFRKYGMKDVADNRLRLESEIYDDLNVMYCAQKKNPKYDNTKLLKQIMKKIGKLQGDSKYAYKMVEKVLDKAKER